MDERFGPLHLALRIPLRLELLRRDQCRIEGAYRAALRESGVVLEELELMVAIVRGWLPTITKLAKALTWDRPKARAAVLALEGRGLVSVARSRRRSIVLLTPEGVTVVSTAIACCRIIDAEQRGALGTEECVK